MCPCWLLAPHSINTACVYNIYIYIYLLESKSSSNFTSFNALPAASRGRDEQTDTHTHICAYAHNHTRLWLTIFHRRNEMSDAHRVRARARPSLSTQPPLPPHHHNHQVKYIILPRMCGCCSCMCGRGVPTTNTDTRARIESAFPCACTQETDFNGVMWSTERAHARPVIWCTDRQKGTRRHGWTMNWLRVPVCALLWWLWGWDVLGGNCRYYHRCAMCGLETVSPYPTPTLRMLSVFAEHFAQ